MSQLLVAVFVTSDQHNLLISEAVCAVVELGVGPRGRGECEAAETLLSPASYHR